MSLVVLSSSQSDYNVENERTQNNAYALIPIARGLQNPYNFRNHINPPMRIKANSEVAVQSLKIHRNAVYDIASDTTYSWYLGEVISDDRWQSGDDASHGSRFRARSLSGINDDNLYIGTTSLPFPVHIRKGRYSPEQMTKELARGFQAAICHPDYFMMTDVVQQEDAQLEGSGFMWCVSNQGTQLLTNRVVGGAMLSTTAVARQAGVSITSASGGGAGTDLQWDTATAQLERQAGTGNWRGAIISDYPISLSQGTCIFDVSNVDASTDTHKTGWRVGFVRPCQTDGREIPPYHDGESEDFFDYVVEWSYNNYTEPYISVKHAMWDPDRNKQVMEEIDYWDTGLTGLVAARVTATVLGADNWDKVHFSFAGEDIYIMLEDDRGTERVLCDTGANEAQTEIPDKNANPKPVGQTCWTMYPAMSLRYSTDYIKLTKLSGLMNGTFPPDISTYDTLSNTTTYQQDADTHFYPYPQKEDLTATPVVQYSAGQSYYMRMFQDPHIAKGCQNIDSRSCYIQQDGVTSKDYVGIDTTADQVCPKLWNGLITMPTNNGWDTTVIGDYTCLTDCVSLLLGFEGTSSVIQSWAGSTYALDDDATPMNPAVNCWWCLPSFARPKLHSSALFVRCNDLTHTSYNMGKGIPSKILYHIPRYGGFGANESGNFGAGELFYEPNEMTYLDLNNPSEINFNDLSIDIVDKNEQWAKDLGGATTLVLHFREKR